MIDQIIALAFALIFAGLLAFIFLPENGMYNRWKKRRIDSRKMLIENGLKFIYDCEYKHLICTLNALAGNLGINADEAAKIFEQMDEMNLVKMENEKITLTDEGRSYALKVIRVHRLWERYLADETSVHQLDWHDRAEIVEHFLSKEETDKLAARIGNPVLDPHGDPIPLADGTIPKMSGITLNKLTQGDVGTIVHIEDEPKAVYSQILAFGFYLGMDFTVLRKSDDRIVIEADGEEVKISPIVAENITVKKQEQEYTPVTNKLNLSNLKPGEKAKVIGLASNCRGSQRRRLMDFGIIPGTTIEIEMENPLGDPLGYRVRGTMLAIRKNQAEMIYIEKIKTTEDEYAV